ncbi:MAG: hypothetical protein K2G55_13605 [Lachnospiraceae bacterium]|nr:hypothetical protein [Lachnospiraceae bacterium]MDE7205104.1 hypothetical protein [Lachnospiraceae bacterium]
MSDYYVIIIPDNLYCRVDIQAVQKAQSYLEECMMAMSVEIEIHEAPAFVDCGGYLQEIACPFCGSDLWDWWGEAMDKSAGEAGLFDELDEKQLPCCGRRASLNDLKYNYPCGFACTEFVLLNPRNQLEQHHKDMVERLLGMQVKVIYSRI